MNFVVSAISTERQRLVHNAIITYKKDYHGFDDVICRVDNEYPYVDETPISDTVSDFVKAYCDDECRFCNMAASILSDYVNGDCYDSVTTSVNKFEMNYYERLAKVALFFGVNRVMSYWDMLRPAQVIAWINDYNWLMDSDRVIMLRLSPEALFAEMNMFINNYRATLQFVH